MTMKTTVNSNDDDKNDVTIKVTTLIGDDNRQFLCAAYPDRDQRCAPKRDAKPASVEQDSKVAEREKEEEDKEKEKRRLERQKVVDRYQNDLDKYNQHLYARDHNLPATPKKKKKKKFCNIL